MAVTRKSCDQSASARLWVSALAASAIILCAVQPSHAGEPVPLTAAACTLEPGDIRTVSRILDAETVVLDDGREVRLIGALAPRASDAGAVPGAWPAEQEALRTLTDLVLGHSVKLAYGGRHTDRYGRHLAHLFLNEAGVETWVQGELLSAGVARVYGLPGSNACMTELLANERLARTARGGLWDTTVYVPKPATMTSLLLARRSHFEIVEGTVASVSPTNSGLYLNFGSDWKTDFTIRIGKDVLSSDAGFAEIARGLAGKAVSVRGWIERRNGPMIDIKDPHQLELPGTADPAPAISDVTPPKTTENTNAPGSESGKAKSAKAPVKQKRPAIPRWKPPGAVDL